MRFSTMAAFVLGVSLAGGFAMQAVEAQEKKDPAKKDAPKQSATDKAIEDARKILEAAWTAEKDPAEKAKLLAAANAMLAAVKPAAKGDPKFTEKVTVRKLVANGKMWLDPMKDQPAYFSKNKDGSDVVAIKAHYDLPAGSEMTQADGTVWTIVQKSYFVDEETRCIITRKPVAK